MKIHQKRLLDRGKIEKLVGALRSIKSDNPEVMEKIRTEADYFERNAERMRYPKFRRQHPFASLKPDARRWSLFVSRGQECSGPFEERTRSWLYAAAISMANLKITGSYVGRLRFHL
jgi:hypothetical protein